jgi:hypothetical protein
VPRDQVDDYVAKICPLNDSAVLVKFKFNILKIVCDHEHYVPLNVPVSPGILSVPAIPAQFWYPALLNKFHARHNELTSQQSDRKSHFLAGLVIHEIVACLPRDKLIRSEVRAARSASKICDSDRSNIVATHLQAITTLRWLLWKHDTDKRYQEPAAKQRVAGIYFPYILLVRHMRFSRLPWPCHAHIGVGMPSCWRRPRSCRP